MDPVARALARHLPVTPAFVRASSPAAFFSLDRDGNTVDGAFQIGGRLHRWDHPAAVLVRPGRAWSIPACFASRSDAIVFHERRTAWCALLAALPDPVVDRLPPAWFLDPALHSFSLAGGLADRLGCRPPHWAAQQTPQAAALVMAGIVVPIKSRRPLSVQFARWLEGQRHQLVQWQSESGLQMASIEAHAAKTEWVIDAVLPCPSLQGVDAADLAPACARLAALLT